MNTNNAPTAPATASALTTVQQAAAATDYAAIFAALRAPFASDEIKWRVGSRTKDKSKGQALPYINARAAMDRLDEVVRPENWSDAYRVTEYGVECTLSLFIDGRWISKTDCAQQDSFDDAAAATDSREAQKKEIAVKGAYSDAFKRAAVKWGIGRYLYNFEAPWLPLTANGTRFAVEPSMPARFLPENERPQRQARPPRQVEAPIAPRQPQQRAQATLQAQPKPAAPKGPAEVFGEAWEAMQQGQREAVARWMRQIVACEGLDEVERGVSQSQGLPHAVTQKLMRAIDARRKAAA